MDNFKEWYTERKGKYILFFGFYIIFFVFLAIMIRNADKKEPVEPPKEEEEEKQILTYDITNLINNDYNYEIVVNDNEELITFKGSKNNVDYGSFENKYFLDIYNINQLLKKSKYIEGQNGVITYELSNSELNELLITEKEEGTNKIYVYVNEKNEVGSIILDLSSYLGKVKYEINIKYIIGETNENSFS